MKRQRARDLRAAIDRLPMTTRKDMLEGIEANPIIAGADGNLRGGVCPLFAASRQPSRRIGRPFARAWDRYAGARLPRAATERELRTLRSMLAASVELELEPEVSLADAISEHKISSVLTRLEPEVSLGDAISEHESLSARTRVEREARTEATPRTAGPIRRDTGGRDRARELSGRTGWAWLRPVRRYDDYERALLELHDAALEHRSTEHERRTEPEEREERALLASTPGRSSR